MVLKAKGNAVVAEPASDPAPQPVKKANPMADDIVKLIVTSPLLLQGQHKDIGEEIVADKEQAGQLLASGRVRRAKDGE